MGHRGRVYAIVPLSSSYVSLGPQSDGHAAASSGAQPPRLSSLRIKAF